jgi:hypothetical protein
LRLRRCQCARSHNCGLFEPRLVNGL